jgi:LemA protein
MKKTGLIILGVVIVLILIVVGSYNSLVTASKGVDNQWAQVQTDYQRRFELIPNLVETVKGITKQEQTVFGEIADARTRYAGATNNEDKAQAANQLESSLGRLLVITENYPQLQSSQAFQGLMAELAGTENRISVERKRYNDTVTAYNLKVTRFPGSITAAIFGFKERTLFQADAAAQTAPKVQF